MAAPQIGIGGIADAHQDLGDDVEQCGVPEPVVVVQGQMVTGEHDAQLLAGRLARDAQQSE